jgi:hypothetical protein
MARDGLFFDAAARVHPKYKTPAAAIIAQALWAGFLVLSGSAETLTDYTGFSIVLFGGVAVLALFVLRRREPAAPRPFKAIGYPIAPRDCAQRHFGPPRPDRGRSSRHFGGHPVVHLAHATPPRFLTPCFCADRLQKR